ncbi:MAG: hypothetical protein QW775_08300, partial [Ignisphaera sp.]
LVHHFYLNQLFHIASLKKYPLAYIVIVVSRSIPYEMGSEWIIKIYALDPGVSLDDEDLEIINKIRSKVKEKEKYIVFGGRPIAAKGVVEALIVFGFISRRISDIKLMFTSSINDTVLRKITHLCRKLGIEGKVVFTGFIHVIKDSR